MSGKALLDFRTTISQVGIASGMIEAQGTKEWQTLLTQWQGGLQSTPAILPRWSNPLARGLFTFRHGGQSQSPYASLNLGFHVGDDATAVRANRQWVAQVLGGRIEDWIVPAQVHGQRVEVVGSLEAGRGALEATSAIAGADGLVTDVPGITLAVLAADCVPILFYDASKRVIGAAHSGWKGTVSHIARRVVETMQSHYGCHPEGIEICLGPSIRNCCYEVDDRVANEVRQAFSPRFVQPRFGDPKHYWLSLQALIRADLLAAGIAAKHIQDVGLCTGCRTDMLYSHRYEAGVTGRQLGAIRLL